MFKRLSHPFKAALIFFVCAAADFLASIPKLPPHFIEANPYARHPDGSFWPLHAAGHIAIYSSEVFLVSLILFFALKIANRKLAEFAAALPFLACAVGHLHGATMNILVKLLYSPLAKSDSFLELFKRMLR